MIQQRPTEERRLVRLEPGSDPAAIEVHVRRTNRSRHIRISFDDDGTVTVSAPTRCANRTIDSVVRERSAWLVTNLHRFLHHDRATVVDLAQGGPIRILGAWIPTSVEQASRSSVSLDDSKLVVRIRGGTDPHDVVLKWLRGYAREFFEQRVQHFSAVFGCETGAISVRNQKTRWGSCSSNGDLSFNWRLVMAPQWILDAIVVHELCHIEELNHSRQFWDLVERRYPRHDEAQAWLAKHGPTLRISRPQIRVSDDNEDAAPALTARVAMTLFD